MKSVLCVHTSAISSIMLQFVLPDIDGEEATELRSCRPSFVILIIITLETLIIVGGERSKIG